MDELLLDKFLLWKHFVQEHEVIIEGHVVNHGGCNGAAAVIMTGHGQTDSAGHWVMDLDMAICDPVTMPLDGNPSFVATPTTAGMPLPVVLSAAISGRRVIVQTWELDASPAANIFFSWHCVVQSHGE